MDAMLKMHKIDVAEPTPRGQFSAVADKRDQKPIRAAARVAVIG
jgi:hypothetical protein